MKKFFAATLLALFIVLTSSASATSSDTVYWHSDGDLPVWVQRNDGSMLVFRISSARLLDITFKSSAPFDEFIVFDVYEIESDGSVSEHPIGSNGGYGMFYNSSRKTYSVVYRESRRFPDGQQIDIENPYQRKICAMLVRESHQHGRISS